jgi:hypothetical protein
MKKTLLSILENALGFFVALGLGLMFAYAFFYDALPSCINI